MYKTVLPSSTRESSEYSCTTTRSGEEEELESSDVTSDFVWGRALRAILRLLGWGAGFCRCLAGHSLSSLRWTVRWSPVPSALSMTYTAFSPGRETTLYTVCCHSSAILCLPRGWFLRYILDPILSGLSRADLSKCDFRLAASWTSFSPAFWYAQWRTSAWSATQS